MKRCLTPALLVGTALSLAHVTPALAQAKDNDAAQAPSADIIVTARRIEERLQDVPISITVFNQEQLSNRNVVNSADLAGYTPSLSVNDTFGSINTAFAIRGFVQDNGTQPSVGVYFADVVAPRGAANNIPIGDGAGPGSFFDLQNVQVLKGPQGTLFGRNTTGGAVLLVPQRPTDTLQGYVEGSVGNYDLKRVQAVINIPLADTFKVRIGVDRNKRDGYLKNDLGVGARSYNDVDYTAVRLSIVGDLTPDLENYVIASYIHSDATGDSQKVTACNPNPDPAANFFGLLTCGQLARAAARGAGFYTIQNTLPAPKTKLDQWQVVNTTTWRASDSLTLKNIVSYAELRQFFRTDLFGTDWQITGPQDAIFFAVNSPIPGRNTAAQSTFTEEFRLQGTTAQERLDWQAGVYLELSNPLSPSGNFSPGFVHCEDPNLLVCSDPLAPLFGPFSPAAFNYTVNKTHFKNVGLYAQSTYKLTDQFSLTGGFRYTWDKVRTDAILANYANGTRPPAPPRFCNDPLAPYPTCDLHFRQKSSAPTWLVDLDYKPNPDTLIYAKYTRGYRAGGITAQAPREFALFKPEKVDTYEAGVKLSMSGPVRGTFSVAGFYNNFSDQQLQLNLLPKPGQSVPPATAILNAGKSRIYGAEVEASLMPLDGLRLDLSYAYLNTELQKVAPVTGSANSPYNVISPGREGDRLAYSPKHKLSTTLTYTLPLGDGIGEISLSGTYTYTSRQIAHYDFHQFTPADIAIANGLVPIATQSLSFLEPRNLVNLNLNWKSVAGLPVDASFFATNVTKEKYYGSAFAGYSFLGLSTATVAPPRMYGVRLRYRFGD